jgi:hypothetical protein
MAAPPVKTKTPGLRQRMVDHVEEQVAGYGCKAVVTTGHEPSHPQRFRPWR